MSFRTATALVRQGQAPFACVACGYPSVLALWPSRDTYRTKTAAVAWSRVIRDVRSHFGSSCLR